MTAAVSSMQYIIPESIICDAPTTPEVQVTQLFTVLCDGVESLVCDGVDVGETQDSNAVIIKHYIFYQLE
jgi:hypothetical protein